MMNDKTDKSSGFMKTGVASRFFGISQATVRAAVKRGDLRGIRIGSHMLVAREPLRLVERTEHTAPSSTEAVEAGTASGQ